MSIERRFVGNEDLELRLTDGEDGAKHLVGYPAVFNKRSVNLGGFVEEIDPRAFEETLAQDDIRGLFNHRTDYVLGRTRSGTMTLRADQRGVLMDIKLPDTSVARDLVVSIERGDITGGSFSFRVSPGGESWSDDPDSGLAVRRVLKARCFDFGPVTNPAYPETEMSIRAFTEEAVKSLEEYRASKGKEVLDALAWQHAARERELRLRGVR